MVDILIGGDVCPIRRSERYFVNGEVEAIFSDLLVELEKADLTVVNLECPLIKTESPILKSGPVLGADTACVNGLKNAHIQVVNLANNHIMDHGVNGLESTISACRGHGLYTVGAGENVVRAGEIFLREVKGVRVGILAFTEKQFSIATRTSPGANPLSLIEYVRKVRCYRNDFDFFLVLLHGGKENYSYPSPRLQEICRFMIEEGANAVICQHLHCPGCYEGYEGGHIVYGQGNFIFDAYPYPDKTWYNGYLVRISIDNYMKSKMNIIPYVQSDSRIGARRMPEEEERDFIRCLQQQSVLIEDIDFVERKWKAFCDDNRYLYFSYLRGHSRLFRVLNRYIHFSDIFYSRHALAALLNAVRCETHREAVETILSNIR
ncbi:MAG: CapA family protein [Deltaproteobacteria bacterium]|jgi:poly-gamma-glutamate synthesis protein (capsule biosynthesis protein)|nr:CapA family protein [Deltaproteobacteria bacterium]